jgi:hypothetical protein
MKSEHIKYNLKMTAARDIQGLKHTHAARQEMQKTRRTAGTHTRSTKIASHRLGRRKAWTFQAHPTTP